MIKRFPLKAPREPQSLRLCAWDTETCKDGYARLVTWHGDNGEGHKYITNPDDLFALFNKMQRFDRHVNYWWNISFDFGVLTKWLLKDHPEAIEHLASFDGCVFKHRGKRYWIKNIPGKFFMLRINKKHIIRHFDLYQFYALKLATAAKKYSKLRKASYDVKNMRPSFIYGNQDLLDYAMQDVKVTYDLAQYLHNQLALLHLNTARPYSKATLAQLKLREVFDGKVIRLPYRALEFSWKSYFGGRFETIQRGMFSDAVELDLNSAYPSAFTTLPDVTDGKWERTDHYHTLVDSPLSFAKVSVEVGDKQLSPVNVRSRAGLNVYPQYRGIRYVTGRELELLKEWPNTSFRLMDGIAFWPNGESPFGFVTDMYEERKRLQANGDDLERMIKIVLNAAYGKTMQVVPEVKYMDLDEAKPVDWVNGVMVTRDGKTMLAVTNRFRAGQLFCPPYGATITADARVKLLRLALDSGFDNVISSATDAIFLKDMVGVKTSNSLGEWGFEGKGDLIMMGTGIYKFGKTRRARGFKKFLPLDEMLLAADKLATSLPVELVRVVKMKAAFKQHRLEDMNKFMKITKHLDLNADEKRDWPDLLNVQKLLNDQQVSATLPRTHPSFS